MKTRRRVLLLLLAGLVGVGAGMGCGSADEPGPQVVPDRPGATKSDPAVRAARRLYDGAPPRIPHGAAQGTCTECHNQQGRHVPELGFAPPMPHDWTQGLSALSRCRQCHVESSDAAPFVESDFRGLAQDLRPGRRLLTGSPPVLPHPVFMRENCLACHDGPAAREAIRTKHPERVRCLQCHVERVTTARFVP